MADLGMLIRVQADGVSMAQSQLDKIGDTADRYDKISSKAQSTTKRLAREIEGLDRSSAGANRSMGLLEKAVAGLVTFTAIKSTLELADNVATLNARMKLATSSMKEYNYVQARLLDTANKAGRPLEEMQNIFIDTAGNLQDMGYSLNDTLTITDSLTYAFTRNATSAQRSASALAAFDFALNKKTVDVNTWKSISSAIPSLEVDLARIYGKSLSEIQKLGFEGKLTVDMLNKTLLESYDENKRASDAMGSSIASSVTALKNNFTALVSSIDSGLGATTAIATGISFLANNLEYALIPAFGMATAGIAMATKAVIAMNVALYANPFIAIAGAIGTATAALYLFRNEIVVNEELGLTLADSVGGAFDEISEKANNALSILSKKFTEIKNEITNEANELEINVSDVFFGIARVARTPLNIVINVFSATFKLLRGMFNNFLEFVKQVGLGLAYNIAYPIQEALNSLVSAVNDVSGLTSYIGVDLGKIDKFEFASNIQYDPEKIKQMGRDGAEAWVDGWGDILTSDPIGDLFSGLFEGDKALERQRGRLSTGDLDLDLGDSISNVKEFGNAVSNTKKQLKEFKDVARFSADVDRMIESLMFEIESFGLASKEIERLTFSRDIDNRVKELSIGMSAANADALKQEAERAKALYSEYERLRDELDNDVFAGVVAGVRQYTESAGEMTDQVSGYIEGTFTHMENALVDFAKTSKFEFAEMTKAILEDLSRLLIKMGMVNAMKAGLGAMSGGGGMLGSIAGVFGFADGGYTGFGAKYEPAGIVHKGEVVFSQADVRRHGGVSAVEQLRLKGYANGGVVGSHQKAAKRGASGDGGVVIHQSWSISYEGENSGGLDEEKIAKLMRETAKDEATKIIRNQKRAGGAL